MDLTELITSDNSLTESDKKLLVDNKTSNEIKTFLGSAAGVTIGVAIGKYLKLSKISQSILGFLGYGVGRLLVEAYTEHKAVAGYDQASKSYKIDTKRY